MWHRLLSVPEKPRTWIRVILWWELRRIPYNLVMSIVGFSYLILLDKSLRSTLAPGEDSFEPIAVFLFAIVANLCYTLGWIVELAGGDSIDRTKFGPKLYLRGTLFSLALVGLPLVIVAVDVLVKAIRN